MVSKLHELSLIHAFASRTNYGQNISYKTAETDKLLTKSIAVHVEFLELSHFSDCIETPFMKQPLSGTCFKTVLCN